MDFCRCPSTKHGTEDSEEESETDDEILDDKDTKISLNRFFKRSDSTLVLGKLSFLYVTINI